MKLPFITTLLCAFVALPAFAVDAVDATVVFRGTFRSPFQRPPAGESEPEVNFGAGWVGPRPLRRTDVVEMKRGTDFGVLFRPLGIDVLPGMPVHLRYVTRFPKPAGAPGSTPRESAESEIECLMGMVCTARYILDEPWEMIPGTWRLEVYSGEKKIVDESMNLIPANR